MWERKEVLGESKVPAGARGHAQVYELAFSVWRRDTLFSDRGRYEKKMDLNVINLNEGHSGGIERCGQFGLWPHW